MPDPWRADYVDVDEDRAHHPFRNLILFITGIWFALYLAKALAEREEQLQQEIKRTPSVPQRRVEPVIDVTEASTDDEEDEDVAEEDLVAEELADDDGAIGDLTADEVEAEEDLVVAEAEKIEAKASREIETLLADEEESLVEAMVEAATVEELEEDEPEVEPKPVALVEDEPVEDEPVSVAEEADESAAEDADADLELEDVADDVVAAAADEDEDELTDDADLVVADVTAAEEEDAAEAEEEEVAPKEPTWVQPIDGECPVGYPIKARFSTGRYHEPGDRGYEKVVPDCCYPDVEDAQADGFTRSRWS